MMLSYLTLPWKGHLNQVLHIFSHLCKYYNVELVYHPSDGMSNPHEFELRDWTSSKFGFLKVNEEMLANMPEPHRKGLGMHAKVDADYASDMTT